MNAVLHKDFNRERDLKQSASLTQDALQALYDSYNQLNLNHPLSLDQLVAIHDAPTWLREHIFNQSKTLKSLPLDRALLLKQVQLPAGAQSFFEAHSGVKSRLANPHAAKVPLSVFEVEDAEVVLNESFASFIASRTETRATSPEQEEVYNELLIIFQKLEDIHKTYPKLQLVGSNQSEALLDQYAGVIKFQPINLKNI